MSECNSSTGAAFKTLLNPVFIPVWSSEVGILLFKHAEFQREPFTHPPRTESLLKGRIQILVARS